MITLEKLTRGNMGRDTTDPTSPHVGVVMDIRNGRAYMRPISGGVEWSAELSDVEPYSLLRLKTAETNATVARYRL